MIRKFLKWGCYAVGGVTVLGALIFGSDMFSYARSSAKSVQTMVKDGVPMEFELQRARDMIEDILPELRANVRVIAQEEVEIAHLRREIGETEEKVATQRQNVLAMRDKLRNPEVAFVVHGRNVSREQMTEKLASAVDRFKQTEAILTSKQRLLDTREKSIVAAQEMLEKSRVRKSELEQKIEALAAQHRLIQSQAVGTKVSFDNSQLANADRLLSEIQKRLETAQRVMAHEAEFVDDSSAPLFGINEADLLEEVDHMLDGEGSARVAFR
jgi:chromosome segregation ATPase